MKNTKCVNNGKYSVKTNAPERFWKTYVIQQVLLNNLYEMTVFDAG